MVKHVARRWRALALACAAIAMAVGTSACGGAPPAGTAADGASTAAQLSTAALLNQAALSDLLQLKGHLGFQPWLPAAMVLPAGHLYDRVVWAPDSSSAIRGFGVFISSSADPAAGNRAIHFDESLQTQQDLANPRNPLVAFKSVLRPVALANGMWYEMQQQHAPEKGAWILIARRGMVQIQVDGLDSHAVLESFASSLTD